MSTTGKSTETESRSAGMRELTLILLALVDIVFHSLVMPVPHNGKTKFYTQ